MASRRGRWRGVAAVALLPAALVGSAAACGSDVSLGQGEPQGVPGGPPAVYSTDAGDADAYVDFAASADSSDGAGDS